MRKRLGIVLVVFVVAAATFLVPTIWGRPWSVDHYYSRLMLEGFLKSPFLLSQYGLLKPLGLTFYESEVDNYSIAFEQNPERAIIDFRKHLGWYTKGLPNGRQLRTELFQASKLEHVEVLLEGSFGSLLLSPGEGSTSAVWCDGAIQRQHEELLRDLSGMAGIGGAA